MPPTRARTPLLRPVDNAAIDRREGEGLEKGGIAG